MPTARQGLPKWGRTQRSNRLPSEAQQPRHGTRQQTRRDLVHRRKLLIADREPRHLHDVLHEIPRCLPAAVLDFERLRKVFERGRRCGLKEGDFRAAD